MSRGPVDPIDLELRRYLVAVCEAAGDEDRMIIMAGVAHALGRLTGWPVTTSSDLGSQDLSGHAAAQRVAAIEPPPAAADAWLLGQVHEALLGWQERRTAGAHYTSRHVAAGLVAWATDGGSLLPLRPLVCDPAAGGGAFLLAAAELLFARGEDPAGIVRTSLWGIELNPVAVAVTAAALSFWAWQRSGDGTVTAGPHLARGDALRCAGSPWPSSEPVPGFDLVVGNPPFQSQLGRSTARDVAERDELRERFGEAAGGYADSATVFLLAACRMAQPGGRVALVQPMSVFAARDAAPARSALLEGARLDGVWTAGAKVFAANVRVGAVVLQVDGAPQDQEVPVVRRATGVAFEHLPDVSAPRDALRTAPSWSHLITTDTTPAAVHANTNGRVGDIASATAGFRDQYYGLIPFVVERGEEPADRMVAPLVTSGLIDPGRCRWGDAPSRFAGRVWQRPAVDVGALRAADPRLGAWIDRVLVPKVLVACQTRVVEAIVDPGGDLVPSVPVIAVWAEPDRLFDLAAVLLAPWTSAWAVRRTAGAALSADAIKLSAKQILDIPLPADPAAWKEGADHLRRTGGGLGDPAAFAATMNRAYGADADPDLGPWWLGRLPTRA